MNVCTLGPECPAGSDCVPIVGESRARCVRSDGADAGVADASRIDARTDAGLCTPGGCDTPLQLALGDGFTCVRPMSGRIWCWGYGAAIARDGDMTGCTLAAAPDVFACPTPAPLRAEDDAMVVGDTMDLDQIDAQELGGCFATHAGVVSCWGTSISAAPLGRNVPTGERARTVQRNAGGTLNGIDRFFEFGGSAIAVDLSGAWYGWGTGAGNVLGLGTSSTLAQRLGAPLADARTVATGERHACGLSGGSVVCWGSNDDGESDPTAPSATPVGRTVIAGVTTATELMMGRSHSCALTDAGLVCWGQRAHLWFDGDVGSCHAADVDCGPTLVPTPGLVIAHLVPVRNADDFCAVDATDGLWCWGEGSAASGQRPARVSGLPPVGSAVIERTHACAISTNSEVWCWGQNDLGQLGRTPLVPLGVRGPQLVVWP